MRQRLVAFLLAALLLSGSMLGIVQAEEKRIVRVGVFPYSGYFDSHEDGTYSGYAVNVMNALQPYTGWNYEWVVGTWSQCLQWIQSGEVDLLCAVRKNSNSTALLYSAQGLGDSTLHILSKSNSPLLVGTPAEALDGVTLGIMQDASFEGDWNSYTNLLGIHSTMRYYTSESALYAALEFGEVDAILSMIPPRSAGMTEVVSFSTQPCYMAVAAGNRSLMNELDVAMERMLSEHPQMVERMVDYAAQGFSTQLLSKDERELAESLSTITVALFDLGAGLCQYDEKTHTFSGVAVDLLDAAAQRVGLTFRYVYVPSSCSVSDAFNAARARMVAPIMESLITPQPEGFLLSDAAMESRLSCVARAGVTIDPQSELVIARPEALFAVDEQVKSQFPNARVLACADGEEAMRAVADGRADLCMENELVALMRLRSPYFTGLASFPAYRWTEMMRVAVREDEDPIFLSLLNKAIGSLSQTERAEATLRNTAGQSYDFSLGETIYQNRVALLLLVGLLLAAVLGTHFYYTAMTRQQQRVNQAETGRARAEEERKSMEETVSAERRRSRTLTRQALFSEQAGIYNRAGFAEATRRMLDEYPDEKFVLVVSDLEHFKGYAELFGKAEEERLIASLSMEMAERFRHTLATYGHLGADCFISCSRLNQLDTEMMVSYMDQVMSHAPKDYDYTVLFGLYVVEDTSLSVNMMIDRALLALRHVHSKQFTRYAWYTNEMSERVKLDQRMITDMPEALREKQFKVYYQPQYSLADGTITGVEALIRWEHPVYGMLSPARFIPLFEENGLVSRLTEYVIDESLIQIRRWHDEMGKDLPVSVNVSRIDTFESGFVERLKRKTDEAGVPRHLLRLEVTETAFIQNENHMVRVASELRDAGFHVEMDDFGSGYSSLNTLKDLHVDTLKLDMRFLDNSESERGVVILVSVVEMAQRMSLPLIAEGVENREQADFLRTIGCEVMQGYYGRRPMPAEEMTEYLRSGARLSGYEKAL